MALARPASIKSPDTRRRHRRVALDVLGKYMLESGQEFGCQAVDMSPGGLSLRARVPGRIGERVIIYLEQIGRIEGRVARLLSGGFAVTLEASARKKEKLAEKLTWLVNRNALGVGEDRRNWRIVPRNTQTLITLPDGGRLPVELIDISLSGAAFSSKVRLEQGINILIGSTPARVVWVTESGVAAEFAKPLAAERFDENLVL
ncbi:MAG: PilZ domain-containing protein [Beijerinckiaceae bacterium]